MAVAAADVKKLRDLTGAGMMDSKKALEESDGDFDAAIELLRIKGAKDVGKRQGRTASNGMVHAVLDGTTSGVMFELNCETDFVAKTEGFQDLAAQITNHIATAQPIDVTALLASELDGKPVQQVIDEANASMGEKIEIRRFARFDNGFIFVYLHKSDPAIPPTAGALVELDVDNEELARAVAQHITAMAPKYLKREDVPADVVAHERHIAEQTAREEGKPEQAIEKITEGRVNSFFKDFCLLEQPYVRENKKTVGKVLEEAGANVTQFARFKVGQA